MDNQNSANRVSLPFDGERLKQSHHVAREKTTDGQDTEIVTLFYFLPVALLLAKAGPAHDFFLYGGLGSFVHVFVIHGDGTVSNGGGSIRNFGYRWTDSFREFKFWFYG